MKIYLDSIDRAALRSRAEQMLHTAGDACDQAGRFMNTTTEKIRGFSLIEFFIYETCLLSFGLWLGTCFSKFFKKFRAIIFEAFAATWLYLLWRVFFDEGVYCEKTPIRKKSPGLTCSRTISSGD